MFGLKIELSWNGGEFSLKICKLCPGLEFPEDCFPWEQKNIPTRKDENLNRHI